MIKLFQSPRAGRIELMDGARGLAVILMVIHHFLYDLCAFLGAPWWLFTNPVFDLLHYIFAGLFIFLAGVSSRFSRSNLKRGVKVFLIAMVMTLVTTFMDMPIRFGVLHLLGFCMVFYGLTHRLWDSIPTPVMPALCLILLVGSALAVKHIAIDTELLWMFGWRYPGFYSSDYFPIFPWLFVFLTGTWAGYYIRERRLPKWFYTVKSPRIFTVPGVNALMIYVIHQPILYGLTLIIGTFIN